MDHFSKDTPDIQNVARPPPPTLGKFLRTIIVWSGGGAVIGFIFVIGTAVLPTELNPAYWIARTVSFMEATEIRGTMVTKAEAARLLVAAQAEEQALVASVKESLNGIIALGQYGDFACFASKLFGQGRNSDYPELRDGLAMGCGLSEEARRQIYRELVFKLRDLRQYIAELEAAAR